MDRNHTLNILNPFNQDTQMIILLNGITNHLAARLLKFKFAHILWVILKRLIFDIKKENHKNCQINNMLVSFVMSVLESLSNVFEEVSKAGY